MWYSLHVFAGSHIYILHIHLLLSGLYHTVPLCFCPVGVIERWELLQAQALSKELRMKQNLQQWQQFKSDLTSIWTWLDQAEEELEQQQQRLDTSTDIHTIELRIKKLKVSHPKLPKLPAFKLWSMLHFSLLYSRISSIIVSLYSPGTTEGCGQAEGHSAVHKSVQFWVCTVRQWGFSRAARPTKGNE